MGSSGTKTVTTPKCTVTYETIETQNCTPRTEKECNTEEVEQETVTYERSSKTPLLRSVAHQGNWAMVFIRGRLRPAMAMVDMELELLMVQESMEEAMVLPSMLLQQSRFKLLLRPPAR